MRAEGPAATSSDRIRNSGLWVAVGIVGVVVGLCAAFTLPLTINERQAALREGGPIETLTVVVLLLASLLMLDVFRKDWRFSILSSICIGLFAARELDAHKAFTTEGVFKIRYYLSSDIALGERLLAAAVVALIAGTMLYFAYHNAGRFHRALRAHSIGAWTIVFGLGLFAFAKVFDGAHRVLAPMGLDFVKGDTRLQLFEESFELAGGVLLMVAVGSYVWSVRRMVATIPPRIDLTATPAQAAA